MCNVLKLCAASMLVCSAEAGSLDPWEWLYPQPAGHTLNGITFGDGQYIAVGERSVIQQSADGTNWSIVKAAAGSRSLFAVTHGNGRFVAVGQQGLVVASSDGTNWTARNPFSFDLYGVAFGAGRFVAVGGDNGTNWMQVSLDGTTWAMVTNLPAPKYSNDSPLKDIAWGDRFVAVSHKGYIISSSDGVAWQMPPTLPYYYELAGVTYGDGQYVAAGPYTILTSTNGMNWVVTSAFIGHYHSDVAYGGGKYVISGNTGVAGFSSNGVNWMGPPERVDANLTDIIYAEERFTAVGENGAIVRSSNGTNWMGLDGPRYVSTFACGPDGCVVSSGDFNRTVKSTSNFREWNVVATNQGWAAVAYLGGRYIASGEDGYVHIGTSLNQWRSVAAAPAIRLYQAAFGQGRYVICGDAGTMVTTSNLTNWAVHTFPFESRFFGMAYGNGRFVGRSFFGDIVTSTNGTEWEYAPAVANAGGAWELTYGNGVFLAPGTNGIVLRTTDGVTWSRRQIRTNDVLVKLIFENGIFFLTGYSFGAPYLLTSLDGDTWKTHLIPYAYSIVGIATYREKLVVSDFGRFLSSKAFPTLTMQWNSGLQLSVSGPAGAYAVESSANVAGPWQGVTNLTAPGYFSIDATNAPIRFYRAVGGGL